MVRRRVAATRGRRRARAGLAGLRRWSARSSSPACRSRRPAPRRSPTTGARQVQHGLLRPPGRSRPRPRTDALRGTPGEELLTGLRGKDVMIAFVESYGRDARGGTRTSRRRSTPLLEDGHPPPGRRRVRAPAAASSPRRPPAATAGWPTPRSCPGCGWTTSSVTTAWWPATGSPSPSAFGQAGWRTVAVMPGATYDWPEGPFYGYQTDLRRPEPRLPGPEPRLGQHAGPVHAGRRSSAPSGPAPDHPPLLAEIALVSSHAPWPLIPDVLDWDAVGDGVDLPDTMTTGEAREAVWAKGTDGGAHGLPPLHRVLAEQPDLLRARPTATTTRVLDLPRRPPAGPADHRRGGRPGGADHHRRP